MSQKWIRWITVLTVAAAVWGPAFTREANAFERQSSQENSVRVDVLPLDLERGKIVRFEIRMNTHSKPLTQDLVAVSSLDAGSGIILKPESWEGSPPGGHHRTGVLQFAALPSTAGKIVLTIRGVAGVPERNFIWDLK